MLFQQKKMCRHRYMKEKAFSILNKSFEIQIKIFNAYATLWQSNSDKISTCIFMIF